MTTLITGGTGKTGGRVALRLQALGHDVRVATRNTTPRFDWYDETTWSAAVAGCDAAYLCFQPDIGFPGADEIIGAFSAAAAVAGCRRLVLLSGRGEEGARRAEQALIDSGADWTILRSAFFLQNFTEGAFAAELAAGSLTMVEHGCAEPFVDADDITDVAVSVLRDPSFTNRTLELTGPRLLGFADVARAVGGDVTYRTLPASDYAAFLVEVGLDPDDAAGLTHVFVEALDGRNAYVADGVKTVLGREPRELVDFVVAARR